jgi:hypothetical protein
MKSKRKNIFAIESPLTLENILAHQMRWQSIFFFATVIGHTCLWNSTEDSDACVAGIGIFYRFINILIRKITKRDPKACHLKKKSHGAKTTTPSQATL